MSELHEIKKGQTGYGVLIENDGFMQISESLQNKKLIESINDGPDGWFVPKPFVVDAVLQKYGIKNANGRIYPEHVLKPEVEKYQRLIAEKMALGECYRPEALILTEEGWKSLEEVKVGENILTLNTETQEIEVKPIIRKIEKDFDGDIINIHGTEIDDVVTPKHEYVLYNKEGEFIGRKTAQEIMDDSQLKGCYIPSSHEGPIKLDISVDEIKCDYTPYKGKVMCVEVENHTWYVMDNGKSHWTSNCNHPSDSTIDLGRISHNIVECHWEGHTLVGKLELNISEGFRKHGICSTFGDTCAQLMLQGWKIGISSRGVGEVKQRMGETYVESYELLAFDIVATPSTPGAYLSTDGAEPLRQYLESPESKSILDDKIDAIEKILKG